MATTPVFDPIAYMKEKNEREDAARKNKPIEAKAAPTLPAVEVKEAGKGGETGAEEPAKPQDGGLNRRERRKLTHLETENARLQGQIDTLKEFAAPKKEEKAEPAIDPNKKPERKDFANDAEFADAISQFNAKKATEQTEQVQQTRDRIVRMTEKADEDYKLIPDWGDHAKAAKDDPRLDFTPSENPQFWFLVGISEYQAVAMDYFCQNPDEFAELVAIKDNPTKLHAEFGALEGHLKRVYSDLKKKAAASEKKADKAPEKVESAPERKKLPVPSESVAPRGGSTPHIDIPAVLEGGKANPAWMAARNAKLGLKP